MSSFIRGKQAGMQNDLSASILPEYFRPDDRSRYGINSQIRCVHLSSLLRPWSSAHTASLSPDAFADTSMTAPRVRSCMAFDPVQSLLAIGTNESKFGSGRVYVCQ